NVRVYGNDLSAEALDAARANLEQANLLDRAVLTRGDAAAFQPPEGPGLLVVNPPHGERLDTDAGRWRALGDLLKQRFKGWKAAAEAAQVAAATAAAEVAATATEVAVAAAVTAAAAATTATVAAAAAAARVATAGIAAGARAAGRALARLVDVEVASLEIVAVE